MSVSSYRSHRRHTVGQYITPRNVWKAGQLARKAYNYYYSGPQTVSRTSRSTPQRTYTYKRRPRTAPKKRSKVSKVCKKVDELKSMVDTETGTQISRRRDTGRCIHANNLNSTCDFAANSVSQMETVLSTLKYYNPAVPGTLTTAPGATGSYSRKFNFTSIYSKLSVRNNYQVPSKVTLYACVPKEDTGIAPTTSITNGLNDLPTVQVLNNPLIYPTDSTVFNRLWKISSSSSRELGPGESFNITHTSKNIIYDPSLVDVHSLAYQKDMGAIVFIIRVEGVLAHDTAVTNEQGFSASGVDFMVDVKYVVKYAAGADIHDIVVTDNSKTFTNGAVLTQRSIADNQAYSVS